MSYFNSIYAEDLPHRAVSVYMYLKSRADKENKCFPAIKTIAKELKIGRSTVQRALADLVDCGKLKKEANYRRNGSCTSNNYELVG